jgi:catechol 2,3-dioxygenase-like lactoylglutathione lyase family enzyme
VADGVAVGVGARRVVTVALIDICRCILQTARIDINQCMEEPMSRVQLALNVSDLDGAIAIYSKLFGAQPAKVRPGYANFSIAQPPLKLVLIEDATKAPGTLNHLGVEVETREEVGEAVARLATQGLPTAVEEEVACCYALQDKVWVDGPGGEAWEIYTVLADVEMPGGELRPADDATPACCDARPDLAPPADAPTCC